MANCVQSIVSCFGCLPCFQRGTDDTDRANRGGTPGVAIVDQPGTHETIPPSVRNRIQGILQLNMGKYNPEIAKRLSSIEHLIGLNGTGRTPLMPGLSLEIIHVLGSSTQKEYQAPTGFQIKQFYFLDPRNGNISIVDDSILLRAGKNEEDISVKEDSKDKVLGEGEVEAGHIIKGKARGTFERDRLRDSSGSTHRTLASDKLLIDVSSDIGKKRQVLCLIILEESEGSEERDTSQTDRAGDVTDGMGRYFDYETVFNEEQIVDSGRVHDLSVYESFAVLNVATQTYLSSTDKMSHSESGVISDFGGGAGLNHRWFENYTSWNLSPDGEDRVIFRNLQKPDLRLCALSESHVGAAGAGEEKGQDEEREEEAPAAAAATATGATSRGEAAPAMEEEALKLYPVVTATSDQSKGNIYSFQLESYPDPDNPECSRGIRIKDVHSNRYLEVGPYPPPSGLCSRSLVLRQPKERKPLSEGIVDYGLWRFIVLKNLKAREGAT